MEPSDHSLTPSSFTARTCPICLGRFRYGIRTQVEVREHESGSHSELLVNTLDRPGLLTGKPVHHCCWVLNGLLVLQSLKFLLAAVAVS